MKAYMVCGVKVMLLLCLCFTSNMHSQVEWMKIDSVAGSFFCLIHSNDCIFIADSTSGLLRSCDNGLSWSKTYDGEYVVSVCEDKFGRILIGTRNSMYASGDGGNSWIKVNVIANSGVHTHISVHSQSNDYYVSIVDVGIFTSTDAGSSWRNISGDIPGKIISMLRSAENGDLYAGVWSVGLHRSIDSGLHWEWIVKDDEYFTDLESSGNILFVVGRIYSYKSVNIGVDWEKMNIQPDVMCRYDDRTLFALKQASKWQDTVYPAKLYITRDTGRTWSLISDGGEIFQVYDMNMTKDGYIFVSTATSLYRTKLPVITSVGNGEIASAAALASSYPNPVSPGQETNINFALDRMQNGEIRLYDTMGRLKSIISLGQLTPGSHAATLTTNGLPPGVYFYTLFPSSGKTLTGKVVVR